MPMAAVAIEVGIAHKATEIRGTVFTRIVASVIYCRRKKLEVNILIFMRSTPGEFHSIRTKFIKCTV